MLYEPWGTLHNASAAEGLRSGLGVPEGPIPPQEPRSHFTPHTAQPALKMEEEMPYQVSAMRWTGDEGWVWPTHRTRVWMVPGMWPCPQRSPG